MQPTVTWQTFDWSTVKEREEHYDPVLGNRSYGLVIFTGYTFKMVFMVQNAQGLWGFPKGHREDGETPLQAAIRETLEETGLVIPPNTPVIKEITMQFDFTITEEQLNAHIQKQIARGEKPHWNKPGTMINRLIFHVVEISPKDIQYAAEIPPDENIKAIGWFTLPQARLMIMETGSNQLSVLDQALEFVKNQM